MEVKPRSKVGLSKLIGEAENGELNSRIIEDFLARNTLDPETRERLLLWRDEFKFWERQVGLYCHMERGFHSRRLVKAMRDLAEPKPGEVWLDAGCGPAKMSEVIWEKSGGTVKKIIAIDIVLAQARERAEKIPVLELKYGNLGERLDFDDETFDGIISNIAIPYVVEFEGSRGKEAMLQIFKELFRALKPGKQLIWSAPKRNMRSEPGFIASIPDIIRERKNIPSLSIAIRLFKYTRELAKKGKEGIYTFLSPKEWNEILEKVGFVNPTWRYVFTHQVWVNKVYKPNIV